jgi:2-polyprenyl-3-methyl-5-hydroxy-6-metoxy-1,4-benzoquinol methylase
VRIHYDLLHVEEYLRKQSFIRPEEIESQFNNTITRIKKFKDITPETRILEIGTGTGWFPILCKRNGIQCEGLEICPQFVEYAKEFGRRYDVDPDIRLGNIEDSDIGSSKYDVIIALSTFEHVEHWRMGIQKVFDALKPEGLFYFYSTNKFSLVSGESAFPCYGLLPHKWRYWIQTFRRGEDIMKLGIDFNQFNHFQLNRFFRTLGFLKVFDQFDVLDADNLVYPTSRKRAVLRMIQRIDPLKRIALTFSPGTLFICMK